MCMTIVGTCVQSSHFYVIKCFQSPELKQLKNFSMTRKLKCTMLYTLCVLLLFLSDSLQNSQMVNMDIMQS